jgi:thymidylate synthase (FAD)
MKLIKQSFEILEQKDFSLVGIKKFIEKCGRVCYKSEDRITDTSYEKFVNMLESRGHDRPLEFGTVHLKVPFKALNLFYETVVVSKMFNNQWIQWDIEEDSEDNEYYAYMTTNYRYYLALLNEAPWLSKYLDSNDNKFYPKRYTVHFIISRGIMDEFRTHVGLSHLAESTRYCNYSKDKFCNEITFIKPCWDIRGSNYIDYLQEAENGYFRMLKNGWVSQQAREVLPLAVKSELISCGFEDAWTNFFMRRCAKDAHPMAREIAIPLQEKFKELNYVNQ